MSTGPPPGPQGSAITLCRLPARPPARPRVRRGTGLKVIHLRAAVWSLATGREEEGAAVGPSGKTPQPLPQILLLTPFP